MTNNIKSLRELCKNYQETEDHSEKKESLKKELISYCDYLLLEKWKTLQNFSKYISPLYIPERYEVCDLKDITNSYVSVKATVGGSLDSSIHTKILNYDEFEDFEPKQYFQNYWFSVVYQELCANIKKAQKNVEEDAEKLKELRNIILTKNYKKEEDVKKFTIPSLKVEGDFVKDNQYAYKDGILYNVYISEKYYDTGISFGKVRVILDMNDNPLEWMPPMYTPWDYELIDDTKITKYQDIIKAWNKRQYYEGYKN